jgi:hypothetical protein
MLSWKAVSKAIHTVTGNCLSKGDCIAIAKKLNQAIVQEAETKARRLTNIRGGGVK